MLYPLKYTSFTLVENLKIFVHVLLTCVMLLSGSPVYLGSHDTAGMWG